MKFTAYVFGIILALASGVTAVTVPKPLEVFDPPILYPHAGTVWYAGQYHNVTW